MARPKGQPKLGGRQKGTPNKLTASVKEAFEATFKDLQEDTHCNLTRWARSNPTDFYKLAAKLIPTNVNLKAEINHAEAILAARKRANAK